MYIMDGIVYAGEPTESLEITKVKPLDDMIMLITFLTAKQSYLMPLY